MTNNSSKSSDEKQKSLSRRAERVKAFHILYAAEQHDYQDSLEGIVEMLHETDLDISTDSYAFFLAKGAIENRDDLDKQMLPFLKNWRIERLGCCTRLILRLALYELSLPSTIPNVVINEAIELAKQFAEKDAYRFINGILDEYIKSHKK